MFQNMSIFEILILLGNLIDLKIYYLLMLYMFVIKLKMKFFWKYVSEYYNIKYKIVTQKQNHMEYIFIYIYFLL